MAYDAPVSPVIPRFICEEYEDDKLREIPYLAELYSQSATL